MLRSVKYGLGSALVAGLATGTVAFATADNSPDPIDVALVVDGTVSTVPTTGHDVADVLADAGYTAGPHDLLAPSADSEVGKDTKIVLNRGRLLHLDIDGKDRDVWTTALTVDQALDQLGVSTQTYVSVSRSQRLPLDATSLDLRSPKKVVLVAGTTKRTFVSTGQTVRDVLAQSGVKVDADDRVKPAPTTALANGQTITVTKVKVTKDVVKQQTDFDVVTKHSAKLYEDQSKVVQPGKRGLIEITYKVTYLDGKKSSREQVDRKVVSEPVDQQVLVGTKKRPAPDPTPAASEPASDPAPAAKSSSAPKTSTSGGSDDSGSSVDGMNASPAEAKAIARAMVKQRGWGSGQYDCLVSLWNRESGWSVHAGNTSSGAYGIPQSLPGSKMASAGSDWRDNARTQISWGLGYIANRYGTPCGAWAHSQSSGWY